jgi:hypothetical protein
VLAAPMLEGAVMSPEDKRKFDLASKMVGRLCLKHGDVVTVMQIMREAPEAFDIFRELFDRYGETAMIDAARGKPNHH